MAANAARVAKEPPVAAKASRIAATCEHVEKAWACKVRQLAGMAPVHALTVSDIVRAFLLVEDHGGVDRQAHSWVDVDIDRFARLNMATALGRPALLVVRFSDAVMFRDLKNAAATGILCGDDGRGRVRLAVNFMEPVRFESRW